MNHLNTFLEMLDSQRIVYDRYDLSCSVEIAMPSGNGYHCFEFDKLTGSLESVWDRYYDYADITEEK